MVVRRFAGIVGLILITSLIVPLAEAKRQGRDWSPRQGQNQGARQGQNQSQASGQGPEQSPGQGRAQQVSNDSDLVRAVSDKRYVRFLEAGALTVTKVLSDDNQGRPHQRWYVRLSNGQQVYCVYNLDMGNRIPLKPGSVVGVGGEFKWTENGGLIHWLHHDPQDRRPDGYVEHDGVRYGTP